MSSTMQAEQQRRKGSALVTSLVVDDTWAWPLSNNRSSLLTWASGLKLTTYGKIVCSQSRVRGESPVSRLSSARNCGRRKDTYALSVYPANW